MALLQIENVTRRYGALALRPIDKALLPNLKNLNPSYLDTAFDPGNRYSVPYAYTLTLLGYNREKMRALGIPVDT